MRKFFNCSSWCCCCSSSSCEKDASGASPTFSCRLIFREIIREISPVTLGAEQLGAGLMRRKKKQGGAVSRLMSAWSSTSDIKFDNRRDSAHETYEQFFLPPRDCRGLVSRGACVAAYFPPIQQRNRSFLRFENSGEARGQNAEAMRRCLLSTYFRVHARFMLASLSSFRTQMQKKEKLRKGKKKMIRLKRIRRRAGGREGSAGAEKRGFLGPRRARRTRFT